MNRQLKTLGYSALAGIILTSAALAQGPGNGGQGGRGGRGGFARPTMGAVTAVDTTAGTITVGGANGAAPQTIKVGADAPIAMETTSSVSDLKVGDPVEVSNTGGPLTITAGTLPDAFGFYGRMLTGGMGGFGRGGRGGGAGGNNAVPASTFTITNGKVTSLNPLTISAGAASVTLGSTADAKVSRISTGQLSGLKVGDQVMALGQPGADGTVTATAVAVGFPQMQGGFGGRQGGRQGFGQGFGQGQGGGQGQGQGGRRRRNRNGGGQNGGGQNNGGQNNGGGAPTQPAPDDNNA